MAGYGSDAAFQTWAEENGFTVPDGTVAAGRARGSAYIDAVYGDRFTGEPVGGVDQERAWPRKNAQDKWGNAIPSTEVPKRIEFASYYAALVELQEPGILNPTTTEAERVVREKVGPIEVQYAGSAGSGSGSGIWASVPLIPAVEGLLAPLLDTSLDVPAILVV